MIPLSRHRACLELVTSILFLLILLIAAHALRVLTLFAGATPLHRTVAALRPILIVAVSTRGRPAARRRDLIPRLSRGWIGPDAFDS